jgi:hypothetical protein
MRAGVFPLYTVKKFEQKLMTFIFGTKIYQIPFAHLTRESIVG